MLCYYCVVKQITAKYVRNLFMSLLYCKEKPPPQRNCHTYKHFHSRSSHSNACTHKFFHYISLPLLYSAFERVDFHSICCCVFLLYSARRWKLSNFLQNKWNCLWYVTAQSKREMRNERRERSHNWKLHPCFSSFVISQCRSTFYNLRFPPFLLKINWNTWNAAKSQNDWYVSTCLLATHPLKWALMGSASLTM